MSSELVCSDWLQEVYQVREEEEEEAIAAHPLSCLPAHFRRVALQASCSVEVAQQSHSQKDQS